MRDRGAIIQYLFSLWWQVEKQVKRHEAFENLLATQEQKLQSLQDFGNKLINDGHFDDKCIATRVNEVCARRGNIKNMSDNRKQKLSDNLLYVTFKRDSAEAESWIDDKLKTATGNLKN